MSKHQATHFGCHIYKLVLRIIQLKGGFSTNRHQTISS